MTNPVEAAIKAEGIQKLKLARQLRIGTTTLWRACNGLKVELKAARKLVKRYPQLNLEKLLDGESYKPKSPRSKKGEGAEQAA